MKLLRELRPAESLILLKGSQAPINELLRLTFADLLIKKVLITEEVSSQKHPNDPARTAHYVKRGPAYSAYSSKQFELPFLNSFSFIEEGRILLRHLIKM